MSTDGGKDTYAELAKLRAQLAQLRSANRRLDRDNRSLRASLRVPRFEELQQDEQDVLLEHFLMIRFGHYEDEGEAGWELLRMLAQEPTWTPAVYDRTWAPSTVSEIRALAAETQGSRLATTLKKMCAMHRDYFLSAVLVPQPELVVSGNEDETEEYEYEYEYEPEHQTSEEPDLDMFEYLPNNKTEYENDPPEYLQSVDNPPEYVMDSDDDIGGDNWDTEQSTATAGMQAEAHSKISTLVATSQGPGVVARWKAVATHVNDERARKAEQFRSVVEAEMERVKAQREEAFGPAGPHAPSEPMPSSKPSKRHHSNPEGSAVAAAEIGAGRASWAPDYSSTDEASTPSTNSNSNTNTDVQRTQGQRKEVDMQAEVIFPYAPTHENTAQLVRPAASKSCY